MTIEHYHAAPAIHAVRLQKLATGLYPSIGTACPSLAPKSLPIAERALLYGGGGEQGAQQFPKMFAVFGVDLFHLRRSFD
jgi:hypothetical protein